MPVAQILWPGPMSCYERKSKAPNCLHPSGAGRGAKTGAAGDLRRTLLPLLPRMTLPGLVSVPVSSEAGESPDNPAARPPLFDLNRRIPA